ncbi:MAG: trypsin-like serine protease [Proteobacteria bacterium]|nr:trypsin-like serine protease [Pseudomonadota bacterium]
MKRILFFLIGMISLCGCSSDEIFDYTTKSQAIMNGQPAGDAQYSGVVAIGIRTRSGVSSYCTGTLIDKNVVLTAAHCVSNADNFPFTTYFNDKKIVAVLGEDVIDPDNDHIFTANRLSVHNYYDQEYSYHDLALLWLNKDVPAEIATPIPILEDSGVILSMVNNHTRFEAVGYGVDDNGLSGKRLWAEGFIGKYCYLGEGYCEYTNSVGELLAVPEGAIIQDLEKGGPCNGDSGGPLLADVNGQKLVMAVVSFGDANCESYSVSTTIADHYPWLKKQLKLDDDDDGCSVSSLYRSAHCHGMPLLFLAVLLLVRHLKRRKNCSFLHGDS